MAFKLHWEDRGVYCKVQGDLTPAERLQMVFAVAGDARFDAMHYVLVDLLDVGAYEAPPGAVDATAAMHIGPLITNPALRLGAIAVRPDICLGLRRLNETGCLPAPYRVFDSPDAAWAWARQ